MSILFMDGFDYYTITEAGRKWDVVNAPSNIFIDASGSRNVSGQGLRINSTASALITLQKDITITNNTIILGCAINFVDDNNFTGRRVIQFLESGSAQISIAYDSGIIRVYRGNYTNLLGSVSQSTSLNEWNYFEFKILINSSTGTVDIRKNEVSILSLTGQNTQATATAKVDRVDIGCIGTFPMQINFDDLVIMDDAGTVNNNFIGDHKIETIRPDGNGNYSNFTGSDGNSVDNYLLVDETLVDDDTTYVQSDVVNDRDSYTFGNITSQVGTIAAVGVNLQHRKDDAGSRTVREFVRISAVDYEGGDISPSTSYQNAQSIREVDPSTSSAWTEAGVNGAEFGYKIQA